MFKVDLLSCSGVYDSLRGILNDGKLDVRVQYMIEVMFAIRKDGFKVGTPLLIVWS